MINMNSCKHLIVCKQISSDSFENITNKLRGAFNKFPDFFLQAFKIGLDTWKFTMLLLYIL